MDDVPSEKHLLPAAIDYRAEHSPNRIWAYAAKSDTNVQQGFRPVTFQALANAVDATAWWLDEVLGPAEPGFPTVAYIGAEDLRYIFLLYACIKTGRRLLVPFPANTEEGLLKLLGAAKCTVVAAPKGFSGPWKAAMQSMPSLELIEVPPLRSLIDQDLVEHYPYSKTMDEGLDDEIMVLQTSGTTGNPKPIFKSHRSFEVWRRVMETSRRSPVSMKIAIVEAFTDSCWPVFLPLSWSATLTLSAITSMIVDSVPIFMPPSWKQPASPAQIYEALPLIPRGRHNNILFIPDVLREFIRIPESLEALKQFDFVNFAGAELDRATGDTIWRKTGALVQSNMGSTDASIYPMLLQPDPAKWYMHRLHPDFDGYHFRHYTEDLYELCTTKQPNDTRQCFTTDPQATVFHTRDLFRRVSDQEDLYTNAGRVDDFIKLDTLTKFNGIEIEQKLDSHPNIEGSLVGGNERPRPFVILQVSPSFQQGRLKQDVLKELWPMLEDVNRTLHSDARLTKEFALIADSDRPLKRTAKNTLDRRSTLKMYEDEINRLYKA